MKSIFDVDECFRLLYSLNVILVKEIEVRTNYSKYFVRPVVSRMKCCGGRGEHHESVIININACDFNLL